MEKKYAGRFTLIFVILFVSIFGIPFVGPGITSIERLLNPEIPWNQKLNLKPGIDIRGGTSLVYEIHVPEGEDSRNLSTRMAQALRKRVDPDGVRNLVWKPLGDTRLEIQMPLSAGSGESRQARLAFAQAQEELERTNVSSASVRAALELSDPATRQARLEALAMNSEKRKALFQRYGELLEKLKAAEASGDFRSLVDTRDEIATVEAAIEATNVSAAQLAADLELLAGALERARGPRREEVRQQREARIQAVRQVDDFPARQAAIDNFLRRHEAYLKVKGTVDDAEGLKRLLRGSGVLEFYITVTDPALIEPMVQRLNTQGPGALPGDQMRWFEVERPEEMTGHRLYPYAEKMWLLLWTTPDKSLVHRAGIRPWGLQRAYRDYDSRTGEYVVAFRFDPQGAALFGELSGNNIGEHLAIVLDGRVISAPVLRSRIEGQGQISGRFSDRDIDYLVRTLNAGSLPARLDDEPIMERTVSPTLGEDNLRRGLYSAYLGVTVVALFMIAYYYYTGLVATVAVVMNLIINIGVLAMFNATFTLPGIAALALTVGMSVDANVLIYERLREEQLRGLSLRMAIRNAYDRAFSAIVDSNVTTIATSLILYWFGSEEIRGFGLTLTIGIMASMFTALFVTRTIFEFGLDRLGLRRLRSFPLSVPRWDRMMNPKIDWIGKAWIFCIFSGILIVAGLVAYFSRGRDMYDIEFVSGTSVQVTMKEPTPIQLVRQLLGREPYSSMLPAVQVVAVGSEGREYQIDTSNERTQEVRTAVIEALDGLLQVEWRAEFAHFDKPLTDPAVDGIVVQPIKSASFAVDGYMPPEAANYIGGVAIVLRDLTPAISPDQIKQRLDWARDEQGLPYRNTNVSAPGGNQNVTRFAVVMVSDPRYSFLRDQTAWHDQLALPTWELVRHAVSRQPPLGRVTSFGAQVAMDTLISAVTAVLIAAAAITVYIWTRFGNFKYGSATIVALVHDVLATVGMIGLTQYLGQIDFFRNWLLIEPLRMNLTLVAAVLTVMGYSVNDTIVVFDRIRENRGRLGHVNRAVINDSITQTLSRTLLTGLTTLSTLFVMYVFGGPGIHGFTFAMLFGILVGTYSSIAIASPILLLGRGNEPAGVAQKIPVAQPLGAGRSAPGRPHTAT